MICETCKAEGKKSRVYEGYSSSTCMGYEAYYDENGKHHVHNPNATTTEYSCSNGHRWVKTIYPKCWCGFPRERGGA